MPYRDVEKAKEYNRIYKREWNAKHRDHVRLLAKRRRELDIEQSREKERLYWKLHPRIRLRTSGSKQVYKLDDKRLATQRYRARKRAAETVDFTKGEWFILLDEFNNQCAYCGESKKLEGDHIIPLSKGGNHTYENIVPACKSCNSAKRDKTADEFIAWRTQIESAT